MQDIVDPATGQTLAQIEQYLRGVTGGDEVAIRNTHGGILAYEIATVRDVKPKSGRLYTDKSGLYGGAAWYTKSGKNCFSPTGQARLFIPTQDIRQFIADNPNGILSYQIHFPE